MLAKSKIISIILIIIFSVSAVTCGIVFGVSKSQPQSGAITGTETSLTGYIGNLLTSDGGINVNTYNSLISKVGAIGSVSSTKNSANINSGTPVVFQMGTTPGGNPVYWQVTYRTKDYITVMMTRPYTVEYFSGEGDTASDGVFGGEMQTYYGFYANYSQSTLREATQQIYTDMNSTNSVLSKIVVSPSAMASATSINWQYSSTQQPDAKYGSSYYSHHNALYSYSGSYFNTWTWDNTVYSDMFWIPSFYELYNTSTSSTSFNGGLWGLSSQSYTGFEMASFLNSGVITSYCWLRSGGSVSSSTALQAAYLGGLGSNGVDHPHGVRPAAHLSLSKIASLAKWQVSFNSNGGSDCASINVLNNTSYGTLPTPTKTGYSFAGWYKNSDLSGSPVSTSDIVTANHTLYAKWNEISFYVTGSSTAINNYEYQHLDNKYITLYINPQTGHYISEISFDNSTFYPIDCSVGYIDNSPVAVNISYGANINTNMLVIELKGIIQSYLNNNGGIHIYIKTTTTPYTELKSSNGANIEGISVTSTKGGTAYIVGDDFDNLTDTDTITFATKPCLSGYDFSHWEDLDGNNLGTEMSIRLQKSQVMDNVITAVYVQSTNSSVNENVSN